MKDAYVKHPIILWADDDPDEIEIMREVLQDFDTTYHIEEARNGQKALQYLHTAAASGTLPCLIVLDINMPVLNGKDTLAHIKQASHLKDIPVVVFTTSSSPLDQQFCKKHHTEMISKPVTFAAQKQVVQTLLQRCDINTSGAKP